MEENIKILEELLNAKITFKIGPKDYGWRALYHLLKAYKELEYKYNRALSDLVQESHKNKELEEENKKWEKYCTEDLEKQITNLNNKIFELEHNNIPISLVEEKIEELNKAYEDSEDENGESEYYYPDYTIRVLEELLERRK